MLTLLPFGRGSTIKEDSLPPCSRPPCSHPPPGPHPSQRTSASCCYSHAHHSAHTLVPLSKALGTRLSPSLWVARLPRPPLLHRSETLSRCRPRWPFCSGLLLTAACSRLSPPALACLAAPTLLGAVSVPSTAVTSHRKQRAKEHSLSYGSGDHNPGVGRFWGESRDPSTLACG